MTRNFTGLDQFANFLARRTIELHFNARILRMIGELIQKRAQEKLGIFQASVGAFPAWKRPLADRTQRERLQQNYTPNDPLLRSGELREDIRFVVDEVADKVVIGSTLDKAVWNELGTTRAPPRPFLGPAAYESKEEISALVASAFVSGLVGTTGSLTKKWLRATKYNV